MILANLGGTLRAWARADGGHDALEEAVRLYRIAVDAIASADAAHPAVLTDLGNGLVDLYDSDGSVDHLSEVIELYIEAVEETDPRSPELPDRLHNRAGAVRPHRPGR